MKESSIEWTDHTWNIAVGCKKVDADCKNCYMYRDSLNGTRYEPNEVRRTKTVFNLPLKIKAGASAACSSLPPMIFTCSLTDFFIEDIDGYRNECWDIIRRRKDLIFQILTKRPERINDCLPDDYDDLDNVWIGTSVGHAKAVSRIDNLINSKWNGLKFVSLEPLTENIVTQLDNKDYLAAISWWIIGGESGGINGKYIARPCELQWMEEIVKLLQEKSAHKIFVKQLGTVLAKQLSYTNRHGKDMQEFPKTICVRDFPVEEHFWNVKWLNLIKDSKK